MITISKFTNQGGRAKNEDSHDAFAKDTNVCAIVADGVGGHGGGEKASAMAVTTLKALYMESEAALPVDELPEWLQTINNNICNMQTPECRMMTTLCVLFANHQECMFAHVGDSRIYYFKDGELFFQTKDHSLAQMAVLNGEITQDEIRTFPERNKILRSMGMQGPVRFDASPVYDVSKGNHVFLMCTDGFWEYIYENEMQELLQQSENPMEWRDKMVELVRTRLPEKCDNYTVVAVWIKNEE